MRQNHIEQRAQVLAGRVGRKRGGAVAARAEDHRAVQLVVARVQLKQQLEHLVADFVNARVGAVNLIDDDDDAMPQLDGLLKHETGLRHRSLRRVDEQQHAVDHFQDTLDLAAEVGMARGIDDIDFHAVVIGGSVLCKDGDAALALQRVAVHHAFLDDLVVAEQAAELEHLVHERGLAVVDMRDDGDIPQVLSFHRCLSFPMPSIKLFYYTRKVEKKQIFF